MEHDKWTLSPPLNCHKLIYLPDHLIYLIIFSSVAGPAQAPVLHCCLIVPSRLLPGAGLSLPEVTAARSGHPWAIRPGDHLPVPVLSLRPPQDGGHPRQQAGQQTTTGEDNTNTSNFWLRHICYKIWDDLIQHLMFNWVMTWTHPLIKVLSSHFHIIEPINTLLIWI